MLLVLERNDLNSEFFSISEDTFGFERIMQSKL